MHVEVSYPQLLLRYKIGFLIFTGSLGFLCQSPAPVPHEIQGGAKPGFLSTSHSSLCHCIHRSILLELLEMKL